jgi:RND superfamily putative drug exporter
VTFAAIATGSILVVGVAVIGLDHRPAALLGKLGRWVDRPRPVRVAADGAAVAARALLARLLGPVLRVRSVRSSPRPPCSSRSRSPRSA